MDFPLICRGLKPMLTRWEGKGFGRDLRKLVLLLESGSAQEAKMKVSELFFHLIAMFIFQWWWDKTCKNNLYLNSLWPRDAICHHAAWSSLVQVMACHLFGAESFPVIPTYWQFDLKEHSSLKFQSKYKIWWLRSGSILTQVMACCLTAPSHYLNQCWLVINKVLWHSSEDIIIRRFEDSNQ